MAARAPLQLSVFTSEKKQQAPRLPAVTHVIVWTLFHAGSLSIISLAFVPAYHMLIMSHPSWLLPGPVEMADDRDPGCCWPAGGLALMLPHHRHRLRHFLAHVALVATAISHVSLACLHLIFVARGHLLRTVGTAAIFIVEVGDLCFLGLRRN